MGGATPACGGYGIGGAPECRYGTGGTPGGMPGAMPGGMGTGGRSAPFTGVWVGLGVEAGGFVVAGGGLSSADWYCGSRIRFSSREMSSSGWTILLDAPAGTTRAGFLMSGGAETTALVAGGVLGVLVSVVVDDVGVDEAVVLGDDVL